MKAGKNDEKKKKKKNKNESPSFRPKRILSSTFQTSPTIRSFNRSKASISSLSPTRSIVSDQTIQQQQHPQRQEDNQNSFLTPSRRVSMFLMPSQNCVSFSGSDEEMSPIINDNQHQQQQEQEQQEEQEGGEQQEEEEEEEWEEQREGNTDFLDLMDEAESVTSMIRLNFGDVTRVIRVNDLKQSPPSFLSSSPLLSPSAEERRRVRFADPSEDAVVSLGNYVPSPQRSSPFSGSNPFSAVNTSSSLLLTGDIENALSRHEESSMMSGLDLLGDDDEDDLDLMDQMASSNLRDLLEEKEQNL